jgi:hypothetical protein
VCSSDLSGYGQTNVFGQRLSNTGFSNPVHPGKQSPSSNSLLSGAPGHAAYIRHLRSHTIYPTLRLYLKVMQFIFIISISVIAIGFIAIRSQEIGFFSLGTLFVAVVSAIGWALVLLVYIAFIEWFVMIIDYAESRIESVSRGMF